MSRNLRGCVVIASLWINGLIPMLLILEVLFHDGDYALLKLAGILFVLTAILQLIVYINDNFRK